jgi:hypothetical protein
MRTADRLAEPPDRFERLQACDDEQFTVIGVVLVQEPGEPEEPGELEEPEEPGELEEPEEPGELEEPDEQGELEEPNEPGELEELSENSLRKSEKPPRRFGQRLATQI